MHRSSLVESPPIAADREPSGHNWNVHPARSRVKAALLAATAVIAAACLAAAATESLVVGGLAVMLLVFSLREFFFPTRYVVDAQGVAVRCLGFERRQAWGRVRRFRYDEQGGFLSSRSRSSLLDAFTGLHLTWNGNAGEIVPVIERSIGQNRTGPTSKER